MRNLIKTDPQSSEISQIKEQLNTIRTNMGLSSFAELKPLKSPFDTPKEPNSRFDKDPFTPSRDPLTHTRNITPNNNLQQCPYCNGYLSNTFTSGKCPNCGATIEKPVSLGIPPHRAPDRNLNVRPKGTLIPKNVPLNAHYNLSITKQAKNRKKDKDKNKKEEVRVNDMYSVEFNACTVNPSEDQKNTIEYVDNKKKDIMKSCLDLAIDG